METGMRSTAAANDRTSRKTGIPKLSSMDSSLSLLREGYTFVSTRCDRLGSDAFRTRLMLTPVVCMRGADAAALVYDSGHFDRTKAMPIATLRLLQDEGSVQQLSGEAHRVRKAMFMAVMSPQALERARTDFAEQLRAAVPRWQSEGSVILHDVLRDVLTRSVCAWASIPLSDREAEARSREFGAMIDHAGSIGPRLLRARRLRNRSEIWARGLIERTRRGEIKAEDGTALAAIAAHVDADGKSLDLAEASVELLNVLRPTVAVGRFIVFGAHALAEHPAWADAFAAGDEEDLEAFVQEVRRAYPFFPVAGARACEAFSWHGHAFQAGDWVLLDLYGTNHDPRLWDSPQEFRPERFRGWQGDPYTLVPQGAGAFDTGHRCPGEWLTIVLMKEAMRFLTRNILYTVPRQDLRINLANMPALPGRGLVIADIRQTT